MRSPEDAERAGVPGQARRLDALDGLRTLAVVSVALYHYCYFWTPAGAGLPLVAYGDAHAGLPFVSMGFLGVHLFFVISGFVILLTLERTKSFAEFLLRRTIRLWPPLIILGTLTFVFVNLFGPTDLRVGWWEYVLSLFVLPPHHVAPLVGAHDWRWLDGAYWSLYVEIKFYLIIGFLYFAFARAVILPWMAYVVFTIAIGLLNFLIGGRALAMADGFFFQPYVPYFSFGIAAYAVWSGRNSSAVRLLAALALLHVALVIAFDLAQDPRSTWWLTLEFVIAQAGIFLLFYAFAWRRAPLSLFQWPPLARIGRASYGVYLLHQNVGVTILSAPLFATAIFGMLGPGLMLAAVIATAVIVHEQLEIPIQSWLKRRLFAVPLRKEPALG